MSRPNAITRAEPTRRAPPPDAAEVLAQIHELQERIHLACQHRLLSIAQTVRLQHRLLVLRHALS